VPEGFAEKAEGREVKATQKKTKGARAKENNSPAVGKSSIDRSLLEFHRNTLALMPPPGDSGPGVAFFRTDPAHRQEERLCSCRAFRSRTCPHILALAGLHKTLEAEYPGGIDTAFRKSPWHSLASFFSEGLSAPLESVRMVTCQDKDGFLLRLLGPDGSPLVTYVSQGADAARFTGRFLPCQDPNGLPGRARVLEQLAVFCLSDTERQMAEKGIQTRRQALEKSAWHRLAYHAFMEFGAAPVKFRPSIHPETGEFQLTFPAEDSAPVFHITLPRPLVPALLSAHASLLSNQYALPVHPVPLKTIFRVSQTTELDLDVRPMVKLLQAEGEEQYLAREDLEKFRYGNLVYVRELGMMAQLEDPKGPVRQFGTPERVLIKKTRIPGFLEEIGGAWEDYVFNGGPGGVLVHADYDRLEIADGEAVPEDALERDWRWLSIRYGIGSASVSLGEIVSARRAGQRYLGLGAGWVDTFAPAFADLPDLENGASDPRKARMRLLSALAAETRRVVFTAASGRAKALEQVLGMKSARPVPDTTGLATPLRQYQEAGWKWLWFLVDNSLGGLLLDEMGLGKTHQVMALLSALVSHGVHSGPFLIVSPTSVLPHWKNKLAKHAPALSVAVHHGQGRDLETALGGNSVLLTSYGILARDIQALSRQTFALAVFDEIQHLKNPKTQSHDAAAALPAEVKIGLTGTPVENSLDDLWALMDLVLPGYLGSAMEFREHYGQEGQDGKSCGRERLARKLRPFTLRRKKAMVLSELPEKTEDLMFCALSEEQVRLYREAVDGRSQELREILMEEGTPVPYIHIFALLNLLKQICCHPALAAKNPGAYEKYESGKWELFKELLEESLDSGQKLVVFSQYLDMLDIMADYLKKRGVDFAKLTGATGNREEVIRRFNEEPECRVFLGSLKAGGVGIDLVAGSVVIHYDRWWNAARENQATDRVHRIGQKRAVQVFKLVCEGTLEEKIAAIIEKKKKLMEDVVGEDDPGLLKTFTREELLDFLAGPGGVE
jgi:superfamily II DNA or RNA helicase